MPKVKVVRTGGKVKKTRVKRKAKQPAPKVNQVSPEGRVLPERIGPNPSLVVIEDNTIRMMLSDPRYLETIPCLRSGKQRLKNVAKKCGHCSRARATERKKAMNGIRACMAGLTGGQRQQLKRLLGAKQVRVVLKGQHVTY
jgi:hypothetical protein